MFMIRTIFNKKVLMFALAALFAFSSVFFVACGKKNNDTNYSPKLTKTYSANGFTIETTSDFVLEQSVDGISLKSEGDNEVSFGDTYLFGQYDLGNPYYDFTNTSLDKYIGDISKIEGCQLGTQYDTISIKETSEDNFYRSFDLRVYVVDEGRNPDGNWDWYDIYCFGKSSNAIVFFKVKTMIQDEYYDQNIEKLNLILSSIELRKPTVDKNYDESVVSYISNTTWNPDEVTSKWNLRLTIPTDFEAWVNIGGNYNDYLSTSIALEENWSSTILFKTGASFMGQTIIEGDVAKHLIKFSTNNYLGFYSKVNNSYYFYYLDGNNVLNRTYIGVGVSCSDQLETLGFYNYFEEQLFNWVQNIEILP